MSDVLHPLIGMMDARRLMTWQGPLQACTHQPSVGLRLSCESGIAQLRMFISTSNYRNPVGRRDVGDIPTRDVVGPLGLSVLHEIWIASQPPAGCLSSPDRPGKVVRI